MQIHFSASQEGVLLAIEGELDRDTLSQNLWASLSETSQKQIEQSQLAKLDLEKVDRVDTAGLAWLLNALRDFRAKNVEISIINIPQKLIDLAKLSNADTLITAQ